MKKILLLLLILPICLGCLGDDDEGIDCALFDPAFPTLYLELVDADGVNLFENGTLNPEDISVEGDFPNAGFIFNPPNELAVPDSDIRRLDNTIQLFIPQQSNFQYTIMLSETESISMSFTAVFTRIPCNLSYYLPIDGSFDGATVELTEVSSLQFLGVIQP